MENYVATLIEKLLEKNVGILFCYVTTMIKQMAIEFCLNNQIYCRVKDFYCNKRKLFHDIKWKSRQVYCDKDFNVAINSSASDKDQGMKYVATFSKFVVT